MRTVTFRVEMSKFLPQKHVQEVLHYFIWKISTTQTYQFLLGIYVEPTPSNTTCCILQQYAPFYYVTRLSSTLQNRLRFTYKGRTKKFCPTRRSHQTLFLVMSIHSCNRQVWGGVLFLWKYQKLIDKLMAFKESTRSWDKVVISNRGSTEWIRFV